MRVLRQSYAEANTVQVCQRYSLRDFAVSYFMHTDVLGRNISGLSLELHIWTASVMIMVTNCDTTILHLDYFVTLDISLP